MSSSSSSSSLSSSSLSSRGPASCHGSETGSQGSSGEDAEFEASHFRFALHPSLLRRPEEIVREVRQGAELSDVLESIGEGRSLPGRDPYRDETPGSTRSWGSLKGFLFDGQRRPWVSSVEDHLVFLYIHLELDDLMGFAQLWQLKKEKDEIQCDPVIVWAVDFNDLDTGLIFERKQLMASLLGATEADIFVLLRASDEKRPQAKRHPRAAELLQERGDTISSICERLLKFDGKVVHCYISAPCYGNFGAIRDYLRDAGSWPPKGKWRVAMYTGSYNIREGLQAADVDALRDLVSDANPLVDVSRFHFFGRERAHPSTRGLGSFSLPSLAKEIGRRDPLLAASIRTFHDEFNAGLIAPDNDRLFVPALTGSDREDFEVIRDEFYATGDIKSYALSLHMNSSLMSKVPSHKKTCIEAFMNDACEAPLCGQLLFMYEWLAENQSEWLTEPQVGRWLVDSQMHYTSVDPNGLGGLRAVQPALADASNVTVLKRLRTVTQAFFLRFLDGVTRTTLFEEDEDAQSSDDEAQLLLRETAQMQDNARFAKTRGTVWKCVAVGEQSRDNPDGGDGADSSCDVVSPRFCGKPMYEQQVRDLGNIMALRSERLTYSSCGGPVLPLAVSLRVAQVLAGAGMAILTFLTSDCDKDEGVLKYPYWIWVPYVVFVFADLSAEIRIFKHLSIPYIQSVGRWQVMGTVLVSHDRSFASWLVVHVMLSLVHLIALGTANIFLGMVTAEHFRGICGPERKMDGYWRFALEHSVVVKWLSGFPFCGLPLIVFGVQFVHLVIDMIWILPGWNQWNTKGFNWRYGKPFPQPLEMEVVEYVNPQVGGVSLLGMRRPNGTRFVYYNAVRHLTTTGAALDHVCLGSGMGTIASMDLTSLKVVAHETCGDVPEKAAALSSDEVDRAIVSTRKFSQDVLSVMNRKIQVLIFTGILFSGCHLQLQVSHHYLRCTAYQRRCLGEGRLWIGIASQTVSSGLALYQILVMARLAWKVLTVSKRCKESVIPRAEQLIQAGSHEHPERCGSAISEVEELQHKLRWRLAVVSALSCLLILLITSAVSKMIMGQFVCKDHIWNFRPNYQSGCVSFSE